ncbi:hypothetical protein KC19_6G063900 [Ceratodon purpureus]|uniref:Protein kinase domain-containing protein n=1 Tax=Ceratodon purpureus TaxID=3225 RepID=A0A8T0HB51_CERPU|nr:hypothetical protein KC19_6G063900 [Ceratodon purpureus]
MVHPMKITAALVRLFKTVRYDEISGDTQPTRASTTLATIPQVASSSNGVASRSEQLKQLRSRCATELEYEIESSKEHWTELDSERSEVFSEELMAENREAFKRLMEKWRCPRTGKCFFHDWGDSLKVRKKIAEGGQAEIFEAEFQDEDGMPSPCDKIVVKVFKSYHPLKDLERIWPLGMFKPQLYSLSTVSTHFIHEYCCHIYGATLLENGRFAFVLGRYWGDLRKLIDLKRRESAKYNFRQEKVLQEIMLEMAKGMQKLHHHKILHRDLKASNVLVHLDGSDPTQLQNFDLSHKGYTLDVADFESSVAVVGTGFWRAPEVLIALKNKEFGPKTWTRKGDVYSYAMTCYEVITGFIPFEDVNINVNDVISGARPSWHNIEDDIDDDILNLVSRCWHPIPLERPSFKEIVDFFNTRLYFVPSSPKNQGERTYSIDYTTEIMNKYYI